MVLDFDEAILENPEYQTSSDDGDSDGGWQSGTRNIPQRLNRLFYSEDFSDLTVELRDGEQVKVHKLILAMHSPVFEKQFYGSFYQQESTIQISRVSSRAFRWIISYMYLGIITLDDIELAIDIYVFAHEKQMEKLVKRCSKFLSGRVTVENTMVLMEMATVYGDEKLRSEAISKLFEKRNCGFVSDIGELSKSALLSIVSSDKIFCSEKEIFSTLYNWAKIQIQNRREVINKRSIRIEMEDFFPFINFLSMNSDFFISVVMKTGVLTSDESISILNAINNRTVLLPSFVSRSTKDRFFTKERTNHRFCLNSFPPCNMTFFYNHAHETYSEKVLLFKATESLYVKSISMRQGCYTAPWKMHILNPADDSEIGVSSNDYSPWAFDKSVHIEANKSYLFVLRGRGKRSKHKMTEYDTVFHKIGFSGFAIACCITIQFCV